MLGPMQSFDHDYVEKLIGRLSALGGVPRRKLLPLSVDALAEHLSETLRYSMGRGPSLCDRSTWFSRTVRKPLVLSGILPVAEVMDHRVATLSARSRWDGTAIETLHAQLEEYLGLVQADELEPAPHPELGPFDIDDWARWHVVHFEHHLRRCASQLGQVGLSK